MAKTSEVPKLIDISEKSSLMADWLNNKLKSVDSPAEQSAYGLNTSEGIIVFEIWNQSPAVQNKV
ncbi:hypothetical protein PW52_01725 [Tamlana sedimentorum]|uniref:Uncharacterized protein n=1 Tax=Neotamlana sedimentorum TaxID=1435349 RepID=A0A0D7WDL7_9FLAO|nr:hypothetical protein [Tamlana sedimentorum]KJD37194.1 hypothetical protein PW52_01725 [Tamlana sedimentorum]